MIMLRYKHTSTVEQREDICEIFAIEKIATSLFT